MIVYYLNILINKDIDITHHLQAILFFLKFIYIENYLLSAIECIGAQILAMIYSSPSKILPKCRQPHE